MEGQDASTFDRVKRRRFYGPLDLHPAVTINRKVYWSQLIVTVITPLMDGPD